MRDAHQIKFTLNFDNPFNRNRLKPKFSFRLPNTPSTEYFLCTNLSFRGVNISLQDNVIATTSNQFGLYAIDNLSSGKYTIVFSYVGYKSVEIGVTLEMDEIQIENIILAEEILTMDPVLVTAQKRVEQVQDVPITMSVIEEEFLQTNSQVNLDVLSDYVPGLNGQFL